ncbi:MAG: hypothetical protein EZS28_015020, partial [Streblomastix strix]
ITIHGDYDVRVQILDLPTILQSVNFYFDSLELDLGSIYLYLWNVFNHLTINNCTFTRSTHVAINQYRLANIQAGGQFIIQQTTIDGKGISGQAPLIEVGQLSYVQFINCIIQNLVVNSLETPVLVQGTNSLDYTIVIFEKVTITGCSAQQYSALYFSISFDNFDHSLPPSRPMNLQIIDSSIISSSQDQYIWGGKNSSEVCSLSNHAAIKVNGAVVVNIINSTLNYLQDAFLIASDGPQVNVDRLSKLENNGLRKGSMYDFLQTNVICVQRSKVEPQLTTNIKIDSNSIPDFDSYENVWAFGRKEDKCNIDITLNNGEIISPKNNVNQEIEEQLLINLQKYLNYIQVKWENSKSIIITILTNYIPFINFTDAVEAKLYDDGYESEGKWFKVKEQDVITPIVVYIPSETKKILSTTSIVIIVVFSVIALIALILAALSIIYCFCITKKKDNDNKQTKAKQIEIKDNISVVSVKTISNDEEEELAQIFSERDQQIFNKQQSYQRHMQQQTTQNQNQTQHKVTRYTKTDFQAIIQEAEFENEKDESKNLNENISRREHKHKNAKKDLRQSRKKHVQSRNQTSESSEISITSTDEDPMSRYSSESMSEVEQWNQEVEKEEMKIEDKKKKKQQKQKRLEKNKGEKVVKLKPSKVHNEVVSKESDEEQEYRESEDEYVEKTIQKKKKKSSKRTNSNEKKEESQKRSGSDHKRKSNSKQKSIHDAEPDSESSSDVSSSSSSSPSSISSSSSSSSSSTTVKVVVGNKKSPNSTDLLKILDNSNESKDTEQKKSKQQVKKKKNDSNNSYEKEKTSDSHSQDANSSQWKQDPEYQGIEQIFAGEQTVSIDVDAQDAKGESPKVDLMYE